MHEIAHLLEADHHVCDFQRCFQQAHFAIINEHFWRRRFVLTFDRPRAESSIRSNADYTDQYKKRQDVLVRKPTFGCGNTEREKQCLVVLRDLIRDACSERTPSNRMVYVSKNITEHIAPFLTDSNLLKEIFAAKYTPRKSRNPGVLSETVNPLMRMLQVVLAPSLFDPRPFFDTAGPQIADFDTSQYMAYCSAQSRPIFTGSKKTEIDFDWCLHLLNFWRCHFLRADEASLYSVYEALEDHERPQYWHSQLGNDNAAACIGKKWKGSYAYLDEQQLREVREGKSELVVDEFNGNDTRGGFQELTLELTGDNDSAWNPTFETVLHSVTEPPEQQRTQAQEASSPDEDIGRSRSFRLVGGGEYGQQEFLADGWFNPLPSQHEVPGWQRMTMMKFLRDKATAHID